MSDDKRYNGWSNYETWAVKLWMDNNSEGDYRHWQEQTRDCWRQASDKSPNRFMDRSGNARQLLAGALEQSHDGNSDHPVFTAAEGPVYADLLNAALSEVDWREIADALLRDMVEAADGPDDDESEYQSVE